MQYFAKRIGKEISGTIGSQVKQSPAVGHGDRLGAAQDIEFFEKRLNMSFSCWMIATKPSRTTV
jgi:hypothetical protein